MREIVDAIVVLKLFPLARISVYFPGTFGKVRTPRNVPSERTGINSDCSAEPSIRER